MSFKDSMVQYKYSLPKRLNTEFNHLENQLLNLFADFGSLIVNGSNLISQQLLGFKSALLESAYDIFKMVFENEKVEMQNDAYVKLGSNFNLTTGQMKRISKCGKNI